MQSKNKRVFIASALFALTLLGVGQSIPAACAVAAAAERVAGFQHGQSAAVGQAVDLIRRGDYSLAFVRLTAERPDTSAPARARILSAYALLLAGNSLGAFPETL